MGWTVWVVVVEEQVLRKRTRTRTRTGRRMKPELSTGKCGKGREENEKKSSGARLHMTLGRIGWPTANFKRHAMPLATFMTLSL